MQNNADCQKECQNTNRECKSWIQYYKDDENVGKNDYHLAGNSNQNRYLYLPRSFLIFSTVKSMTVLYLDQVDGLVLADQ